MSRLDELKAKMNQTNNTSMRTNTTTRLEQLKKQNVTQSNVQPSIRSTIPAEWSSPQNIAAAKNLMNATSTMSYQPNTGTLVKTGATDEQSKSLIQAEQKAEEEAKKKKQHEAFLKAEAEQAVKNNFNLNSGKIKSNYTLGTMQVQYNDLMNEYYKTGKQSDYDNAQRLRYMMEFYQNQNENVGKGGIITKDFVTYIPQFTNQQIAGVTGAAIGAGTGAGTGAIAGSVIPGAGTAAGATTGALWGGKTGYVAGITKNSFEQMRGSAYGDLLNMGVPDEIAKEVASDTGLWQSIIEGVGAGVDLATLGIGKLFSKGAKTTAQLTAKKLIKDALLAYGINIIAEGVEEGAQEVVSIKGEKTALEQAGIQRDTTVKDDIKRVYEAGKGGMTLALVTGGGNVIGNISTNVISQNTINQTNKFYNDYEAKIKEDNTLSEQQKQEMIADAELGRQKTVNEINNKLAQQNVTPQSPQTEQTQPTNEVIPPTTQNQNTANIVRNNANVQKTVQNQSNIEQISQNNVENAPNFEKTVQNNSELQEQTVETNVGNIPVAEYRDIMAQQAGFNDYADMRRQGYKLGNKYDVDTSKTELSQIQNTVQTSKANESNSIGYDINNKPSNENYVNTLPTQAEQRQKLNENLQTSEDIIEKSQELFDELFANENLPQTYKFEMGERIERATTLNELDKIRNEIQNYKSDLSKETIDERVVRVNEFIEAQKTKGEKTTKKEIRNKIMDLLEIPNKGSNVKALSQIADEINQLLSEGKLTDSRINEIVEALPEQVRSINEDFLNEYKELRTELKKRPIYVSENIRKGFPNWNDFKKNNLNKLKLTKDNQNITVEQLYQELSGQYEDLFPSDISNPADQLEQISNVVSSIKRDVEDIDTVLIGKYGQEGWNEIQDMLKDELKTIRDNLARTNEPVEYYEGGIKNRSWTKTSNKNELVNEFLDVKDIQYQVQSNPSTVRMANETLNNLGYEESYNLIKNTIASGRRVKAEDIALGERLIQESIKKGDFERATELISDVTIIGTELGQAVQAMRLINKLSPQGQLMYLQKVVNRMNAQNAQKNAKRDNSKLYELETTAQKGDQIKLPRESKPINPKLYELETKIEEGKQIKIGENEIKIPQTLQNELLKAQTQEEIDLAIEKIKDNLAKQLPVETFEKLDEWRYLSMLGRPKSHLRNVLSNVAMRGTYELKNGIQRIVEPLAKNSLDERTRTFKKSTETVKNFAKQSAEDNLNAIKGNGKLTVDKDIKSRRKIFNSELLERARKFNSNALDMEDTVFSKSAYVSNLAEYLTANGIKTQQDIDLNPDIVEKGIQFAINESQKTTFRQYSALANAMNQVENINGISKVIIGGTLPFKKTPINIAKTGASYSPAGLIETLTLETKKLRDGKITGNEYIDRLSQGLTGTLITGLGYLLADIGVLSGAGEEDDEYAEAIGERAPYSINIGNGHYNLSWLSPTAMPMFIGAEIQKAVQNEEDVDLNNIVDFLATTLDPLSEMSMVSSINDAIKNYGSSETSTGAISSVAGNAVGSYAGQYLPSIFSDINKIIDPTVRSTQASKNSKFKSGERLLRQSLNKLPGGSYLLEPATDIWGNEKKRSDNVLVRAADALISPGTYTQKKTTDVDRELMKQYDENSNKDIIPKVPKNYFSSNGYKYEMSAKEYTNYKKEYGQTAYKELQKLFNSKEYQEMDEEEKQKAIKDVYENAQEKARYEYGLNPKTLLSKYDELEASRRLLGAKRSEKQQLSGVTLMDFYNAWQAQKDVEGTKNWKGKSIAGSEKENKIKAMKEAVPDLKSWQLNKLYDLLN